jgi:hypothetical protein
MQMRSVVAAVLVVLAVAGCASGSTTAAGGARSSSTSASPPVDRSVDGLTVGDYRWADDGFSLPEAFDVTLVRGLTPEAALDVLCPGEARMFPTSEAAERWAFRPAYDGLVAVTAGAVAGFTLLIENNGFMALQRLRALSARGLAVSAYRNVNALSRFNYARRGRMLLDFDPLLESPQNDPHALPELRGISFGDDDLIPMARSFLLAARLTGLRLLPRDVTSHTDRLFAGCVDWRA